MGRLERILNKVDHYNQIGRFDDALTELAKALKLAPDDPEVYLSFALTYDTMGVFDHSVLYFKKAIELNPQDTHLWTQLGITLSRMGKYNEALEVFQHALTLDPNFILARWNRALTFRTLGCIEDSISDFTKCISSNRESDFITCEIRYQLGLCYFDMGWTREALNELRHHIELFPNDEWAHLGIGNCFLDLGWIDESINKYEEIIELFPDFIPAYNSLAISLAEKGWFDEALNVLRSALEIAPHDESLMENISYIESLKNDDDGAKGIVLLSIISQIIRKDKFKR